MVRFWFSHSVGWLALTILLAGTRPLEAQSTSTRPGEEAALSHFEKKVRPILVAHCHECHSADAVEIRGGLALDTRDGIRRGGDSGPAVVPGDVSASLLIKAVRHQDGYDMPPEGKLSEQQIADLVAWVEAGAIDPREGDTLRLRQTELLEQAREFWAFKRPVKQIPQDTPQDAWSRSEVDRFIRVAQQARELQQVGDAPPHVLLRRLHLDLIGLPPTREELQDFLIGWDRDPMGTWEETVDRLLASPHFGERWGRHWLDVARFAETSGKETNFNYPQAWRYRDYVINAFNSDLPFDQFVREQLAGDLIFTEDDTQWARQWIATGFLALGPKSHLEPNRRQFEMDLVDEQIDAVTQAFLGMTVACARCHDHKFDPISQADYYALAGIFLSSETLYGTIPIVQNRYPTRLMTLPDDADMPDGVRSLSSREREQLAQRVDTLREQRNTLLRDRDTGTGRFIGTIIQLATLEGRLNSYREDGRPKRQAMGMLERRVPRNSALYVRGELDKPGETVRRGFPHALTDSDTPRIWHGSGRLELAQWIGSDKNPLTARVIVNRVWQHLFGRGLVATPDNFGLSGEPPSHPELLDYLAVSFTEDDWSIKRLIRRLVLSRVYTLDGEMNELNFERDPDNIWLWRTPPRRLDAEVIRDAMLATAGRLELEPPTGSLVAEAGEGFSAALERSGSRTEQRFAHRAIYLPVIRGGGAESLLEFDGVDGSFLVGQRATTTVPSQSLYLLNSPFVHGLAASAAQQLIQTTRDPVERISIAYYDCFSRAPSDEEVLAATEFLERYQSRVRPARGPAARWTGRGFGRGTGPGMRSDMRPGIGPGPGSGSPEVAAWTAFHQSLWATGEFLVRP